MAVSTNKAAGITAMTAANDETHNPIVVDRLQFSANAAGSCVVVDTDDKPVCTFRTAGVGTLYLELHRKLNGVKISSIAGSGAILYVLEQAGVAG